MRLIVSILILTYITPFTNVALADTYSRHQLGCHISGTKESIADPGHKFELTDRIDILLSAVYAQDFQGQVTPLSKSVDQVKLYSNKPIPAEFLARFNQDALSPTTGVMGQCRNRDTYLPSLSFELSRSDILFLVKLLGGDLRESDPYTVTWANYGYGYECYLSPGPQKISADPTVQFNMANHLSLAFQAVLPPTIQDGLSFHIQVRCEQK